jgi:uncharacterized protein (TIGR03790 family)
MKYARILLAGCLGLALAPGLATHASRPGDEVVVVYNRNLSESKDVAEHYALRRGVPRDRVVGLDLPKTETMTRDEYNDLLAKPLLNRLRQSKLFVYYTNGHSKSEPARHTNEVPIEAKIRYATLCYGVPLKILSDAKLIEEGSERLRPELRRNEAAVDSELTLLPILAPKPPIFGPVLNRFYGATNASLLNPTNGLLLVARLDGPTPEIARRLVDQAMEAEEEGLWGRAYFDARGLTNTTYKIGDDWIRGGAEIISHLGFETVLDTEPATFPASFPMSQIAFYAGWYDGSVSGPFTRPKVEFMPGAFAYHLHSFSAQTIRSATANWVGPLLDKGATVTMGCVEEPYLEGTPDIRTFLARFTFLGFSFGEAAWACQSSLSWQSTVVGDPLYRPFALNPFERHEQMLRRKSKRLDWSFLRAVDMNLANGVPQPKIIEYLELLPQTYTSSVLLEKLADLCSLQGKSAEAIRYYRKAIEHSPTPQQHVRLMLSLSRTLTSAEQGREALEVYQDFLKTFPDYPDPLGIYRKIGPLVEQYGKTEEKEQYEREIQRLSAVGSPIRP